MTESVLSRGVSCLVECTPIYIVMSCFAGDSRVVCVEKVFLLLNCDRSVYFSLAGNFVAYNSRQYTHLESFDIYFNVSKSKYYDED